MKCTLLSTAVDDFLMNFSPNFGFSYLSFSSGNIRNTEKLSYDNQQHYKIMVTAFDCGQMKATESVPVHIEVKPVCKPGWQGQSRHHL